MKTLYKEALQTVKIIIVAVIIGAAAQIVIAADPWKGAPGTPPGCPSGTTGCDAPINVGATEQTKQGVFNSNTRVSAPSGNFTNVAISDQAYFLSSQAGREVKWYLRSDLDTDNFVIKKATTNEVALKVNLSDAKTYVKDVCIVDTTKCLSGQTSSTPGSYSLSFGSVSTSQNKIIGNGNDWMYLDCPSGSVMTGIMGGGDSGGGGEIEYLYARCTPIYLLSR